MVIPLTFKLAENVGKEDIDGTIVLLKEDGAAAVLNRQASALLAAMSRCASIEEAADFIYSKYDVSEERARADIEALATALKKTRDGVC